MLPYAWARLEQVDGATLVRLSDGSLALPEHVVVTDLETNETPVDEDGKKHAIAAASADHIEVYDYDAPVQGDEFPIRHYAGRYSVVAKPLEQ